MGSLVWVNYSGDDELTIDLSGQLYKVPPQANGIPGRLQIDVQPGYYRYTASVPYGSLNGEINVAAGQVTGINIVPGIKESPVYEIGEKVENPPVELKQYEEDLTGRAGTAPQVEATPTSTPVAASEAAPAQAVDSAAKAEGVTVKNFTGDTLIFTINNQAYNILANSEQMITLSPGTYNYTASLPFVATTGTVNLSQNQGVELSVAINIAGDVMSVYQN